MSAAAAVAAGRHLAESLMVDTCTVRRRTGEVTDPGSGVVTPTHTTVYSGPCKVQQRTTGGRADDAGEAALQLVQREVHLPVATSTQVRTDDEVTITAVADISDPGLIDRVFVVRGAAGKTFATARRLVVDEVTS